MNYYVTWVPKPGTKTDYPSGNYIAPVLYTTFEAAVAAAKEAANTYPTDREYWISQRLARVSASTPPRDIKVETELT